MDFISSIIEDSTDHITHDNINGIFQFSCNPLCQQQQQQDQEPNLVPVDQFLLKNMQDSTGVDHDHLIKAENSRRRWYGVTDQNTNKKKRIIHREIERQRRQEMATLYSSLRFHLPLPYLKGKRSISDHIHEAANYIKHMEEKIQQLSDKRDELKRLANYLIDTSKNPSSSKPRNLESGDYYKDSVIEVKPCWLGVEVVVDAGPNKEFPLSRIIAILCQEGFNVVGCISSKVNQRMLHSIKSEVREGRSIAMSELQQKLTNSVA